MLLLQRMQTRQKIQTEVMAEAQVAQRVGTGWYLMARSCMCQGSCSFWQWAMAGKLAAACACAPMLVSLSAMDSHLFYMDMG